MSKDIILFVNAIRPATFEALELYRQKTGRIFTPVVIVERKIQKSITERNGQKQFAGQVIVLSADFDSPTSLRRALKPYTDRIFAVTSQYENSILELKKLVPYLPYLSLPTETSLDWATEKKLMRRIMGAYDTSLIPQYMEVKDSGSETIREIERKVEYPMIVKPSGLEGSLLVALVKNRQELAETVRRTLRHMQEAYDVWIKRQAPLLLVEEFMDGDMYSIDAYVSQRGDCSYAPPVKVVTGRNVGFDDFFGYMHLTPAGLDEKDVLEANETVQKACRALGLKSLTAHVELMKLPSGWKIIELGPRIGGYRHDLYKRSYGMNHIMNDILNRAGEKVEVSNNAIMHTATFKIYAHQEGILRSAKGVQRIQRLSSFVSIKQDIKPGQRVQFAKNNGDPIFEITLSNKDKDIFEADVRSMQLSISIKVEQWDKQARRGFATSAAE